MCADPVDLEGLIPFVSSIPSTSYTCSASSYSGLLEPWWEEFDGDIPFRAKYSKVPHSLCISGCGFCISSHLLAGGNFCDNDCSLQSTVL